MAGIPRDLLPQIPGDKYEEFQAFLRENGVAVKLLEIPVTKLKPIQAHVNRKKIESLKKNPEKLNNPIIVSQTGLILDGHHRYLAKKELDPNGTILCIVAMCGMTKLIELGHQFDGSFTKSVYETTTYGRYVFEGADESELELIVRRNLRPKD